MNKKIITGFTVVQDPIGVKIAYVYSVINENGKIIEKNVNGSYIVTNQEIIASIDIIKADIQVRLKEIIK